MEREGAMEQIETAVTLVALTNVHQRCKRHLREGRVCGDCLIETQFHIEVRAVGEIMTAGAINQWREQ